MSGAIASDSAAVDPELFIVETVSRLKPAHLRILRRLYVSPSQLRYLIVQSLPTVATLRLKSLHSSIKTDKDTAGVLVTQLTREHLVSETVDNTPIGPQPVIRLTSYGAKVCKYLRMDDADAEQTSDEPP